jgi:uncharacterized protein (TIGR03067 family)
MKARQILLLWAAWAFGALSPCGSARAGDEDAKLLKGKWRVASAKQNGGDFPKDRTGKMLVAFEKDEIRFWVEGTKSEQGAKFAIDPSTDPKRIDFTKETRDSVGRSTPLQAVPELEDGQGTETDPG